MLTIISFLLYKDKPTRVISLQQIVTRKLWSRVTLHNYLAPAALNNSAHWPALKNSAVNWGAKSAYVHPGL